MNLCERRLPSLVGALTSEERAQFEAHLATCAACSSAVAASRAQDEAIRAWAKVSEPSPFAAKALVRRATEGRPAARRWLVVTAVAVAVAAALLVSFALRPGEPTGPEVMLLAHEGAVAIFEDSVTVGPEARATVERRAHETRVRIERGALTFRVSKRDGGRRFVVESNELEVRVVGTVFSVHDGAVAVEEGVVEVVIRGATVAVLRAGETWPPSSPDGGSLAAALDAGVDVAQALVDAGVPRAPRALFDVEAVTRAMVEGNVAEAQRLLDGQLGREPKDARAWVLQGDLFRRSAQLPKAVEAYEKGARFAKEVELRTRARFQAAAILQDLLDDRAGARRLLEACLAERRPSKTLEAPALVRLAKLELSEGKTASGRRWLELVLTKHPTTPSAVEARTLLDQLR